MLHENDASEALKILERSFSQTEVYGIRRLEGYCMEIGSSKHKNLVFIVAQSDVPISDDTIKIDSNIFLNVVKIPCIMPAPLIRNACAPFDCVNGMRDFIGNNNLSFWEVATLYESRITGLSRDECLAKAIELVDIYETSIKAGLKGTVYEDRILGPQSVQFERKLREPGALLNIGVMNTVIAYISSFMEVKSSFGLIVAGPTAGSCACVPGCILGFGHSMGHSREEMGKAILVCGLIGALIATKSTFAAEEGGCQAECGAAGSMAAAGLVFLKGGSIKQCITAASLTLQSLLGMVCDPIGNRVEAPCLMRNIAAASMAASSANMALADYTAVIPYDEVLAAHWEICQSLPRGLKCTGLSGLAAQPTARRIEEELIKGHGCGSCCGCGAGGESVW